MTHWTAGRYVRGRAPRGSAGSGMAKNILIFSDGTGQVGGQRPDQRLSNIYKLYRATRVGPDSDIDPARQIAFYDPGLGTDADAASMPLRFVRSVRKFISSATGAGLGHNIADCYAAILQHYQPGDRVYIFGFSRGAYTARCVAGVLGLCGVAVTLPDGTPIPRYGRALRAIADEAVYKVYQHGSGRDRQTFAPQRRELAKRFRQKYASDIEGQANVVPYFVGVFDTVAALGSSGVRRLLMIVGLVSAGALTFYAIASAGSWLFGWQRSEAFCWLAAASGVIAATALIRARVKVIRDFPKPGQFRAHWSGWSFKFYDTYLNPRVRFARHALAIDETRDDFRRVPWGQKARGDDIPAEGEPERFEQIWFAGNHSDIGGSYEENESRLSDVALGWMVEQATALPDPILIDRSRLSLFPDAAGMQHCEVESLLERWPRWWPRRARFGWKTHIRIEAQGAPTHPTVLERFEAGNIIQCGRVGPYLPAALLKDPRFARFYPAAASKEKTT